MSRHSLPRSVSDACLLFICFLALSGCTEQSNVALQSTATVELGVAGGMVETSNVRLLVPRDALRERTTIVITETSELAPEGLVAFSPVIHFEPNGLTFEQPVRVEIAFSGDPKEATLYWSTSGDADFDAIDGLVSDVVIGEIHHFSRGFVGHRNPCGQKLKEDPSHCGTCARTCSNHHGQPSCREGVCGTLCDAGFGDCDGDWRNGCETDLTFGPINCGACGRDCSPGSVCASDGQVSDCACEPGFEPGPAGCRDVDECATANGGCAQSCTNTSGSYACTCDAGYALASDGHACDDVDECATANGGCAQSCANTPGSYACACDAGYALASDGHACDDVNECATANGGCAQSCANTSGSYACACDSGYVLAADSHGCEPVGLADWSWSRHSTGPLRMIGHSVGAFDHKLFVLGGRAPQCVWTNIIYDPYNDEYTDAVGISTVTGGSLGWNGEHLLGGGGFTCDLDHDVVVHLFAWNPVTNAFSDVSAPFGSFRVVAFPGGFLVRNQFEWMVLDGATLTWSPMDTVGFPGFDQAAMVGLGNSVFYLDPDGQAALYDPSGDSWTLVSSPPISLGASPRVVGLEPEFPGEVFVWNGTLGAIYDSAANAWTMVETSDSPSGLHPEVFWTGSEVVVLDDSAGGHYDPLTDTWRSIETKGRFWPGVNEYSQRDAVWTGEEIVVYGGELGSGRYGPRPLPNPSCFAGSPDLMVGIAEPVATRVRNLGGQQSVEATIQNTFSIQRVEWRVDGVSRLGGLTGTIDLTDLGFGAHQLLVEVEDQMGNVACDDRILYIDRAPILSVQEPVPYQIVTGDLQVSVDCFEDGGSCPISVQIGPTRLNGVDSVDALVDVSALDHSFQTITIEALDAHGLASVRTVPVHIESSPSTSDVYYLDGTICDILDGRVLLVRGSDFIERVLATGEERPVAIGTTSAPECSTSRLTSTGAVLDFTPGSALYYWEAGSVSLQWIGSALKVVSPWVLSRSGQLQLRDLETNTVTDLGSTSVASQLFLASDGTVFYGTTGGGLYRYLSTGVSDLLTTLVDPPSVLYVRGNRSQAIWREMAGSQWLIRRFADDQITTIAGPSTSWGGSGPGTGDLAASGDYVAYTRPDAIGVLQVYLQSSGTPELVTGFGDETRIAAVDEEGDVAYRRANRTWVRKHASGEHFDVASSAASVHGHGPQIWFVDGNRIIREP